MNNSKPRIGDDELLALLTSYDEALAFGLPAPPTWNATLDAFSQSRLGKLQDCLRLLEQAWPRFGRETTCGDNGEPRRLGRFEIVRELGRGAGGVVFLVHDPKLGRQAALKVPRPEALVSQEMRLRFLREGRAAAGLEHGNIVPVFEAGDAGGVCYIVSGYCPGPTMAAWLKQPRDAGQFIAPRHAALVAAALADAVEHAHRRGVLHRDIKPSNVLLAPCESANGLVRELPFVPRLTDFGLAKLQEGEPETTRTGTILGTPSYMAPEQAQGKVDQVGPAADVYGLGATLYELLTGQPPFRAASLIETVEQIVSQEPPAPRRFQANLPRDLVTICLKCLEKDPAQRYLSAGTLAEDLRHFLAGEPIRARRATPRERLVKWARRRPAAAGLVAVAAVVILATVVTAVVWQGRVREFDANLANSALRERQSAADADRQRRAAEEQEWWRKRNLYGRRMHLAFQSWHKGNFQQTNRLLDELLPLEKERDMRGLEWHVLDQQRAAVRQFQAFTTPIQLLEFAPDGRSVYAATVDRFLKRFDSHNQLGSVLDPINVIPGPVSEIWTMTMSRDRTILAVGHRHGGISLFDSNDGKPLGKLLGHTEVVTTIAFSYDGATVVSGSDDDTVRLWDLRQRKQLAELRGHTENVHQVLLSPDGKLAASSSSDRTVRLWDVRACKEHAVLRGHQGPVGDIAFAPDGMTLVSAGDDKTVRLWDVTDLAERACLATRGDQATALAIANDSRLLAMADKGLVEIWDMRANLRGPALHPGVGDFIRVLTFAPDGQTLAVGSHRGQIALTEVSSNSEPCIERRFGQVWCVAFSPDGQVLASGGEDRLVHLIDPATYERRAVLGPAPGVVRGLAFSPDGQTLAAANLGGSVELWDLATGKRRASLHGHQARVDSVCFSPDGRIIASASWDKTARLWDAASGQCLRSFVGHTDDVRCVAFSVDGQLLATGSEDHTLRIWNAADGRLLATLEDVEKLRCVAFTPDGTKLVTGNVVGQLTSWDVATRRFNSVFRGHSRGIRSLAFAPDGLVLVTGGTDGTVRFWDIVTEQEMLNVAYAHEVIGVALSPDGTRLAVAGNDGAVRMISARR